MLASAVNEEDGKIHIFSLATGHLYERLLRIMMLSVTKRTSLPVKFWLFENYLSPSFKTIAAAMAQEYHFEVCPVRVVTPMTHPNLPYANPNPIDLNVTLLPARLLM